LELTISHGIFALLLSAAASWGGAKFALTAQEKKLTKHDADIEKLREDMGDLVLVSECKDKQVICSQFHHDYGAGVSAKLDLLFKKIDELESKREAQKDERNKIISNLATQIAVLDNTIKERSNAFRKPEPMDSTQ
jgi:hypothetical protein